MCVFVSEDLSLFLFSLLTKKKKGIKRREYLNGLTNKRSQE